MKAFEILNPNESKPGSNTPLGVNPVCGSSCDIDIVCCGDGVCCNWACCNDNTCYDVCYSGCTESVNERF